MQISKSPIISGYVVYTENVRCTRLMQRSLQVVIQQKFVLWMLYPHPPILMPKEFQSLVYILYFFC